MTMYIVLYNTFDYYRFTDYLGAFSSLEEAREITNGLTFVVDKGEQPFDQRSEENETPHFVIIRETV